jgi:serine protease Do
MSLLAELQEAVAGVATAAAPSVVGIGSRTRGSGVVIADGAVLTNAHNLRGTEVTVRFADGRATRGTVAGVDWDGDLAVVSVDTTGATAIAWSTSPGTIGSAVFAAAATPSGGARVSFGFVSSVERAFRGPGGRRISGSIEHTAPLAPGSSGSALLDADGALVGLNTNRVGEGFYLALPADAALKARVDALSRGESRERPRLGIAVAPAHVARRLRRSVGLPELDGVLVRGVEEGSPAEAAGIAEGDLLVTAAGKPVTDVDTLHELLRDAGFPLELVLVRGTEERAVTVTAPAPTPTDASDSGDEGASPDQRVH